MPHRIIKSIMHSLGFGRTNEEVTRRRLPPKEESH